MRYQPTIIRLIEEVAKQKEANAEFFWEKAAVTQSIPSILLSDPNHEEECYTAIPRQLIATDINSDSYDSGDCNDEY